MSNQQQDVHSAGTGDQGNQLDKLKSAALEATANGVMITNREGVIVWVNPAFERLTGYSSQEVVGQSTRLLKSGLHPPSFYKILWETVLAGNQWQGELTNRRKDGSLYTEHMTISPVRDGTGEIAHFVAVKEDFTDRNNTRDQLYLLAQALEGSSELIGVANPEGRLSFSNRAFRQTLGYSEDEARGKHFGIFLSANNPPGLNEEIAAQSYQGAGWRGECLIPRGDGTDMPAFLSSSQIKDSEGRLLGVLGIAQDITERKKQEQLREKRESELIDAQRMAGMGNFLWTLATGTLGWSLGLNLILRRDPDLPTPTFQTLSRFYTPTSWEKLTAAAARVIEHGNAGRDRSRDDPRRRHDVLDNATGRTAART